jgi:hypothetical protein
MNGGRRRTLRRSDHFRKLITEKKFMEYLARKGKKSTDFSCGWHKNFVLEQLGYEEDFSDDQPMENMTKFHRHC